jgi:hypothetical protein
MRRRSGARRGERGAALIFAIALVAVLAIVGVAIIRLAGNDQVAAAKLGARERGLACADAGIQYGRRFFGTRYEASHGWNDYLSRTTPGYRYDTTLATPDARPTDLAALPLEARGASDGAHLDAGADMDGDGAPDFWVSIRDDDDERPLGAVDDRTRDNNETVLLRSECTNPSFAGPGGAVVVEVQLTHVQGGSGYGNAQITSNSPDIVGVH